MTRIQTQPTGSRRWIAAPAALFAFGVLALLTGLPEPALAGPNKALICHYPPGNPDQRRILSVGGASVSAHLGHGDNLLGVEVCDLVDNDCDGLVDEDANGAPLTNPTSCGVGECAGNTGFETCVDGSFTNDTCDPFDGATGETCDALDNDCDGPIDEDQQGNPLSQGTTCGTGECAGNTGVETCLGGTFGGDTCNPFDGASAELCDGLDNDCDGSEDNGDLCGLGEVCEASSGCVNDPALTCPCDADLDAFGWDTGSIPFGGCVSDSGNGFPQYGLVRQVFGGPDITSFTILVDDVEPDGFQDYTCRILYSEDGIDGDPPSFSSFTPIPEGDLLGCAVRMSNSPESVLDCILP